MWRHFSPNLVDQRTPIGWPVCWMVVYHWTRRGGADGHRGRRWARHHWRCAGRRIIGHWVWRTAFGDDLLDKQKKRLLLLALTSLWLELIANESLFIPIFDFQLYPSFVHLLDCMQTWWSCSTLFMLLALRWEWMAFPSCPSLTSNKAI